MMTKQADYTPRFNWNKDTLTAFRLESNYISYEELLNEVEKFVENCSQLEDGETEEDLIRDLLYQIFNYD